MGELPPTGGAAFIAAGGVAHTRGGGGVIWLVDIPEGEGALFGTKGRALGQPASLCHTKWVRGSWVGDAAAQASPTHFGNSTTVHSGWQHSKLINKPILWIPRVKTEEEGGTLFGVRGAATPCRQAPTFGDIADTWRQLWPPCQRLPRLSQTILLAICCHLLLALLSDNGMSHRWHLRVIPIHIQVPFLSFHAI